MSHPDLCIRKLMRRHKRLSGHFQRLRDRSSARCGQGRRSWHQDEARGGQQDTLSYVWADKGSRPRALKDLRTTWAYLFGSVCAERGVGTGLVLPFANTSMMNLHLIEISKTVTPGHHAVLVLDGAGWHRPGARLTVPDNISLMHLPPYRPELNPVENIRQYLRQNQLGNRVFNGYTAIVDACRESRMALMNYPEKILSIADRSWERGS